MVDAAKVTTVFQKWDLNKDGFIDRKELQHVLRMIDEGAWPDERIDILIETADANKDGKIDYEELIKWIFNTGELQAAIIEAAAQIIVPLDEAVARELTWARTKPAEVAQFLKGRLGDYKGKEYYPPEKGGGCIVTKEGVTVVEEAIAYLEALEPRGSVGVSSAQGLALAGEDHVVDIGKTGTASHSSSDGTSSAERVKRYGSFTYFGECLWYGSEQSNARAIVIDLIVDDGVESRGHRLGVYDQRYDIVGVAYGPHTTFGRVVALEFAQEWQPDEDAICKRVADGPVNIQASITAKAKAKASTHWKLGNCVGCGEPIKGGRTVEVKQAGGMMHVDCFKCSSCSNQLSGKPFKNDGKILFCTPCYAKKNGDMCAKCGESITGAMMKCSLGKFHPECVVCSKCGNAIGRAKYSTTGGVITCAACCSAQPKSAAKAKSKAKAKAKVSMAGAQSSLTGLGMDYASLG